jgi:hypothetical protein
MIRSFLKILSWLQLTIELNVGIEIKSKRNKKNCQNNSGQQNMIYGSLVANLNCYCDYKTSTKQFYQQQQ